MAKIARVKNLNNSPLRNQAVEPLGEKMREIRFRAWDRERKQMGVVDQMTMSPTVAGWRPHPENKNWSIHLVDGENADFMQYTGLKDKNGKEIYEGDIVQYQTFDGMGAVVFDAPEFIVIEHRDLKHSLRGYECEVIGNRFENPELLGL